MTIAITHNWSRIVCQWKKTFEKQKDKMSKRIILKEQEAFYNIEFIIELQLKFFCCTLCYRVHHYELVLFTAKAL